MEIKDKIGTMELKTVTWVCSACRRYRQEHVSDFSNIDKCPYCGGKGDPNTEEETEWQKLWNKNSG